MSEDKTKIYQVWFIRHDGAETQDPLRLTTTHWSIQDALDSCRRLWQDQNGWRAKFKSAEIHVCEVGGIVATMVPPELPPPFHDANADDMKAALERRGYTVTVPGHEVDGESVDRVLESCEKLDDKCAEINRAAEKVKEN